MLFHPHDKKEESGREKRGIVHIAKIGEKREKTFNFSPFCGIINYIKKKTNLIQMLDFTVFVHISKCIKIVQVKRRIPENAKTVKKYDKVLAIHRFAMLYLNGRKKHAYGNLCRCQYSSMDSE